MATTTVDPVKIRSMTRASQRKLSITVLLGGPSREREVSLHSGEEIAVALESLGHDVHRMDINPGDLSALEREVDAVFIALHGTFGEDGAIQRILESKKICYTGSDSQACGLAMDKVRTKQRLIECGLPTPPFRAVTRGDLPTNVNAWTLPVVVKPVSEGSSIMCTIVRDVTALLPAVEAVVSEYGAALIEEFVPGLELTVGILGQRALPPIEIRPKSGFYDYFAKYQADDTEYRFDIDLPQRLLDEIARQSLRAHEALGCRDFSRVDWRVDGQRGRAQILEINTIPGFTQHSLLPMAARRAGIPMPQLCQMIVDMALERH